MKYEKIDLFPTPLLKISSVISEIQKADILSFVGAEQNTLFGTNGLVMSDGGVSTYPIDDMILDTLQNKIPSCSKLKNTIQGHIESYCKHVGINMKRIDNSWISIQCNGSRLNKHIHGRSAVSGVFYIKKLNGDQNTFFYSPNPYVEFLDRNKMYTKYTEQRVSVPCDVGDMILFPSWLFHDNDTIISDEERIILSFNTHS